MPRAKRGADATAVGDPATGLTYGGAGVDIAAGEAAVEAIRAQVASTRRTGVLGGIGGFGGLFALDTARYRQPVLVSSTDGVGTKLAVARATGRYSTIGIDLVAMCVDDLVCSGAEPLFVLDYLAVGRVVPERVEEVVSGITEGCRQAGCALLGGETAEHPRVMADDDLDVAGFAVGVVEADAILGPERVRRGDVLVGLLSPGLRSNGYALARRALLDTAGRPLGGPAWSGADHSLADELLRPSVIYTPAVLAAAGAAGGGLHACAHITGGGIPGNLPRALPADCDAVVERSAWEVPRVFTEIAEAGPVVPEEMERVFNLGLGMVLVCAPTAADAVLEAAAASGRSAAVVGEVTAGAGGVRFQ